MSDRPSPLHRLVHRAETSLDSLRHHLRRRLGRDAPLQIVPYRGFGTADQAWLMGRVLEDKGDMEPSPEDDLWTNLLAMYRRFESDEVPDAAVEATWGTAQTTAVTDEEGYFEMHLPPPDDRTSDAAWHPVALRLTADAAERYGAVEATGRVLIPPPEATFGIISDVDDTVLKTGASNLLTMVRTTLAGNARTRVAFRGVDAFYRALVHGDDASVRNPLFFVSSSPWNLYDFLVDFFRLNRIPDAPILLRDLGIDETKFIKSGHGHKVEKVQRILSTYPDLSFILIGDSGQEDPELYQQVIQRHPDRILAVYIRDVTTAKRGQAVRAIVDAVRAQGVEMLLVPDTLAAAEHAAAQGYIRAEAVPAVREACAEQAT
jgi:phosphatidate phosphatase APP1